MSPKFNFIQKIFLNTKSLKEKNEITEYINKVIEEQERREIINLTINKIRGSLDLDEVFHKTVEEIGYLFEANVCIIAFYDEANSEFIIKNEYLDKSKEVYKKVY